MIKFPYLIFMELKMEAKLYEAAVQGNVPTLLALLRQDNLLLDRFMVGIDTETPLHISAMLGHLEFVNEILDRKPELASEQDSQRSTPLHLAAAKGYLDIVKNLLAINPDVCFIRDRYERNPIHVAVVKGRVDVLEHLVREKPEAARSVDGDGYTVLHLCVKHNNLEALRISMEILNDRDFINARDQDGNTTLHLAAMDSQSKTIDFLVSKGLQTNVPNLKGFTAQDLLAQINNKIEASELMDTTAQDVKNYNATRRIERSPLGTSDLAGPIIPPPAHLESKKEKKRKWQIEMQKSIMVVAVLLATVAFQAGMTPPGGVWQDDPQNATAPTTGNSIYHKAGASVIGDPYHKAYKLFIGCNTTSFLASLSIIQLLISGLPMKRHRVSTWILMLTMWVAITFTALTYALAVVTITPDRSRFDILNEPIGIGMLVWIGLMAFIFLCHIIRLLVRVIRMIFRKLFKKKKKQNIPA